MAYYKIEIKYLISFNLGRALNTQCRTVIANACKILLFNDKV